MKEAQSNNLLYIHVITYIITKKTSFEIILMTLQSNSFL